MSHLFKTQFNPNYKPTEGETNVGDSMTVPDMSLSIRELLINHSRGVSLNVNQPEPQYFDMEIPNFIDLTDREAYKEMLLEKKLQLDEQIKAEIDAAKQAAEKPIETPPAEPEN